jgi:predicted phosphodiesterase
MKTAILADIHSNLKALEAVLEDIEQQGGVVQYWCLGDIVDYGPLPHECLEIIRQLKAVTIIGNHDLAVVGNLDTTEFAAGIEVVTRWTKTQLSQEELDYLKGLPLTVVAGNFTLAHGSPRDPVWEYILSRADARENLAYFETRFCLVGHTHIPLCFQFPVSEHLAEQPVSVRDRHFISAPQGDRRSTANRSRENLIDLNSDCFVINPGSVGQPRDNDSRAAYAIYDPDNNTLEFRRVKYDIGATQKALKEYGLPRWFGERLSQGV